MIRRAAYLARMLLKEARTPAALLRARIGNYARSCVTPARAFLSTVISMLRTA